MDSRHPPLGLRSISEQRSATRDRLRQYEHHDQSNQEDRV